MVSQISEKERSGIEADLLLDRWQLNILTESHNVQKSTVINYNSC